MINRGRIRNFSWAKPNIVNKAALRRRDTLVRHIDPPAKHDGLLCRLCLASFWFLFLVFWFSVFNVYN